MIVMVSLRKIVTIIFTNPLAKYTDNDADYDGIITENNFTSIQTI